MRVHMQGKSSKITLKWPGEKTLLLLLGMFAIVMVGLAIAGGVRAYTPVPFWDMWDGYLNFYIDARRGDLSAWWRQQNEHRIVLAHMLFWLDLAWFGGSTCFLIVVNYLLVASGAMLFYRILRELAGPGVSRNVVAMVGLLMTGWLFSWMQHENLTWAFQSQFMLAQLLPLCAFYCFHKSLGQSRRRAYFGLASLLGVASAGTMANGVLVLPLLVLFALIARQRPLRVLVLVGLAGLTLYLYFHTYLSPPNPGSLGRALKEDPLGLMAYVLRYLGSPFFYLADSSLHANTIALLAGGVFTVSAIHRTWTVLRGPRDSLKLVLLIFILYLGGTALGTAGGRMYLEPGAVFSSRYTTPSLMAWAALLLLYASSIFTNRGVPFRRWAIPALVLCVSLLHMQSKALMSASDRVYQGKLAGLALAMGVHDPAQVKHIYPSMPHALAIADLAAAQKLSIFGMAPWLTARQSLGKSSQVSALPLCRGSLDNAEPTIGEHRFIKVRGWLFDARLRKTPGALRFLTIGGTIIGYAITGERREDVAQVVDRRASYAGFRGYVQASQIGQVLIVQDEDTSCQLTVKIPVVSYSLAPAPLPPTASTTAEASVLPGNEWLGADYDRTAIDGMRVYGSLIQSDADIGSISLQLRRGESLLYRSGPTGGHQLLEIAGKVEVLPVSPEWTLLELSGASLPEGKFVAKFIDNGGGWGEWSAIAVKNESR
jgi:hypothetical protein